MILLAIETSCDETSVAIVKRTRGKTPGFQVLSHKVLSQVDLHAQYGGVFPALAKREHAKALTQLIAEALGEAELLTERTNPYHIPLATRKKIEVLLSREHDMLKAMTVLIEGIQKPSLDAIAVTRGPGLEPALWVGINGARALHEAWDIPLYPINHMEGHILTSLLQEKEEKGTYEVSDISYPALALLISGGHTELVRISKPRSYTVIGKTKDDAVGEAFDKTARLLGMPYPGGPAISQLAEKARRVTTVTPAHLTLPRPMLHSGNLDFSFSGLKTAVLTRVKKESDVEAVKEIVAFEFENAVTDVLVAKVKQALYETGSNTLIVGGGVSANTHIRNSLKTLCKEYNTELYLPERSLSTDNALMIAATGIFHIHHDAPPRVKIEADGNWSIETA